MFENSRRNVGRTLECVQMRVLTDINGFAKGENVENPISRCDRFVYRD